MKGSFLLLVSILVASVAGCASQAIVNPMVPQPDWPTQFEHPGTLGAALEPSFGRMLDLCHVYPLSESVNHTSIPDDIRLNLDLKQPVVTRDKDAMERIFRHMFEVANMEDYKPDEFKRELQGSALSLRGLPVAIELSTNVLYYQNCATVLDAAIEAKLDLPRNVLEAGILASTEQKSGLGLVSGTFRSPLATGLLRSTSYETRIPLLLEVWGWYLDNPKKLVRHPTMLIKYRVSLKSIMSNPKQHLSI